MLNELFHIRLYLLLGYHGSWLSSLFLSYSILRQKILKNQSPELITLLSGQELVMRCIPLSHPNVHY